MAAVDYKSAQPVRSEADGADARVQVKIVDSQNPGTQQMTVDSDSNAHVEVHGNDPTGTDKPLRVSEDGATKVDGLYDATLNTKPSTTGVTAQTRNASYADSRQVERPTAKRGTSDTDTVSLDVSLHDESGNAYSQSNPLPVAMANEEIGTPVHSYNETASAIAPGGSQTIDYTVAGSAMTLKRIVVAASGACKVEIFTGNATTPTQKYTIFTSESRRNEFIDIPKNFTVAVADIVRVKFTSLEPTGSTAFTGYATIEGMLA
jgi:hypothetical protein